MLLKQTGKGELCYNDDKSNTRDRERESTSVRMGVREKEQQFHV